MATITPHSAAGAPYSRLLSVGSARGSRVVTNEEICTMVESTPEWIEQRTGIRERRWIADGESELTLAVAAARTAVERSGLQLDQIDALIVATTSAPRRMPSLACLVADELGMATPAAFDLQAACAGFGYACGQADALVRAGSATHVLVVGVDVLSPMLDLTDRSTVFLFGDGAGAVVIGPSETPGIGPLVWGSNPSKKHVIETDRFDEASAAGRTPFIAMEGAPVFKWATTFIAHKAKEVLERSGLTPDDLEVFIPHQANNRIIDSMLRHLKFGDDIVVARDIAVMGNTSAASIPLAMDELLSSGQAHSGQTALHIGFGAGLVYAGQVVILP